MSCLAVPSTGVYAFTFKIEKAQPLPCEPGAEFTLKWTRGKRNKGKFEGKKASSVGVLTIGETFSFKGTIIPNKSKSMEFKLNQYTAKHSGKVRKTRIAHYKIDLRDYLNYKQLTGQTLTAGKVSLVFAVKAELTRDHPDPQTDFTSRTSTPTASTHEDHSEVGEAKRETFSTLTSPKSEDDQSSLRIVPTVTIPEVTVTCASPNESFNKPNDEKAQSSSDPMVVATPRLETAPRVTDKDPVRDSPAFDQLKNQFDALKREHEATLGSMKQLKSQNESLKTSQDRLAKELEKDKELRDLKKKGAKDAVVDQLERELAEAKKYQLKLHEDYIKIEQELDTEMQSSQEKLDAEDKRYNQLMKQYQQQQQELLTLQEQKQQGDEVLREAQSEWELIHNTLLSQVKEVEDRLKGECAESAQRAMQFLLEIVFPRVGALPLYSAGPSAAIPNYCLEFIEFTLSSAARLNHQTAFGIMDAYIHTAYATLANMSIGLEFIERFMTFTVNVLRSLNYLRDSRSLLSQRDFQSKCESRAFEITAIPSKLAPPDAIFGHDALVLTSASALHLLYHSFVEQILHNINYEEITSRLFISPDTTSMSLADNPVIHELSKVVEYLHSTPHLLSMLAIESVLKEIDAFVFSSLVKGTRCRQWSVATNIKMQLNQAISWMRSHGLGELSKSAFQCCIQACNVLVIDKGLLIDPQLRSDVCRLLSVRQVVLILSHCLATDENDSGVSESILTELKRQEELSDDKDTTFVVEEIRKSLNKGKFYFDVPADILVHWDVRDDDKKKLKSMDDELRDLRIAVERAADLAAPVTREVPTPTPAPRPPLKVAKAQPVPTLQTLALPVVESKELETSGSDTSSSSDDDGGSRRPAMNNHLSTFDAS